MLGDPWVIPICVYQQLARLSFSDGWFVRGCCFFVPLAPFCGYFVALSSLCAFASLADEAKGGDGAKSALREISLFSTPKAQPT
jgi:hypothetical protein